MQPATPSFLQAIRYSHVIAAKCDLVFPGSSDVHTVPVEAGSITIDRTAQNRRTGQVTIPWSLRIGEDLGLDLRSLPLGGYAMVRRGIRYADGTTELILLGTLRVESVSWDTQAASASLELADRMAQVRDEPFTGVYAAAGRTAAQAAVDIVTDVFGTTIAYHTPYAPTSVIGDVYYSGTRTDALSQLEQGYGAETYFDAAGDFVFDQKPGDSEPVVWTVDAGEIGVMTEARESLDRTGIYNGVLVRGQAEADQPPIQALATYDDVSSPVRWGGPFGRIALISDSSNVTDQATAQSTAEALLHLRLKQTRSLELRAAPNPALEAGDTIGVVFPDGRTETHLIDATVIDLATDSQAITTRSQISPTTTGARGIPYLPIPDTDPLVYGREAWTR